jgi:hypothetical protein
MFLGNDGLYYYYYYYIITRLVNYLNKSYLLGSYM